MNRKKILGYIYGSKMETIQEWFLMGCAIFIAGQIVRVIMN